MWTSGTTPPPPPPPNTLVPIADAYVRNGTYANTNYGSATGIDAKAANADYQRQIFLKFDISGISGSVNNATLKLYGSRSDTNDATFSISANGVSSSSWTESGITDSNKPTIGSVLDTQSVLNTTPAWISLDVSSYIQAAQANNQSTVTIAIVDTASTQALFDMSSREGANPAQLSYTLGSSAPAAPTGLTATSNLATSVALSWADNANNETGYKVERKTGSGSWTTLTATALDPNTVTYTDTTAQPGTSYTYRVYATGSTNSGYSNELAVTTPALTVGASDDAYVRGGSYTSDNYGTDTTMPVKLVNGSSNDRQAFIKFTIPAGVTSVSSATFRVYGSLSSLLDGTSLPFNVMPVSSTTWSESTLTYTNKPTIGGPALGTVTLASTTDAWYTVDVTSYIQSQLAAGQHTISLAVVGTVNGTQAAFNIASHESPTGNGPQLSYTVGSTPAAPAAPTSLAVTSNLATSVGLSWTDNATTETGYKVERQTGTGAWTTLTTTALPPNMVAYTDTTAQPGVSYNYRVYATGSTNSGYSNTLAVTTPALTVGASDDAYVRGGTYTSDNYGTDTTMPVKLVNGSSNDRQAFIKFTIPTGVTSISSATFRVYGSLSSLADAASLPFYIKSVASTTWDESTLTYTNKPAIDPTALGTVTLSSTTDAWYTVDVTSYIQSQLAAGQHTISLAVVGTVNGTQAAFNIASHEATSGNGPQLIVSA